MEPPALERASGAVRARAGDAAGIAVALVVGSLATDATGAGVTGSPVVDAVVGLVAVALLWWRRRAPLVVAALTFVAAAVAPSAAGAAIVSVFTVAAQRSTRVAVLVAALYLAPGAVAVLLGGDEVDLGENALGAVLFTAGALGWGTAARHRRQAMAALADRAERAEAEQHARIAEARRAERTRIAAEMHDVLAHRLSMLSLHAGALEHRPDAPAEDRVHAAAVVRDSAHRALEELRVVVGVLRDHGPDDPPPAPTAEDLAALVEESRAAGVHIERVGLADDLAAVPAELTRHVYRIVQEGLTNARKHAAGRPVRLVIERDRSGDLTVEITNRLGSAAVDGPPGTGLGLVGLRERVTSVGGTLTCGVDGAGDHRLRAHLPWPS